MKDETGRIRGDAKIGWRLRLAAAVSRREEEKPTHERRDEGLVPFSSPMAAAWSRRSVSGTQVSTAESRSTRPEAGRAPLAPKVDQGRRGPSGKQKRFAAKKEPEWPGPQADSAAHRRVLESSLPGPGEMHRCTCANVVQNVADPMQEKKPPRRSADLRWRGNRSARSVDSGRGPQHRTEGWASVRGDDGHSSKGIRSTHARA